MVGDCLLVIIGSVLSFAFIYMIQNFRRKLTVFTPISTLIAVLLGAIIFGEVLTVTIAIGGAITLFGLFMVNKSMEST
jgi:drug/metabolite transporter (DMT)-like permease